MSADEVPASRN